MKSQVSIRLVLVATVVASSLSLPCGSKLQAESPPAETPDAASSPQESKLSDDERIEQKLREIISVEFLDTPISDVVEYLKEKCDVEIQLDTKALEEVGVGTDMPITIKLRRVMLKSALRHLLRNLELVYTVQDGVILITTPEVIETHLQTKIYPVRDLIQYKDERGQWQEYPDELIELIIGMVRPNTWDSVGGPGSIPSYDGMLIVSQTQDIHEEIVELLAALRKLPRFNSPDLGKDHAPVRLDRIDPQEEKIDAALNKLVASEVVDQPLDEVIDALAEKSDINMILDRRELDSIGVDFEEKITRNVQGMRLGSVLKLMLEPLELETYIRDEVLIVTSKEQVTYHPITMAYPVADLLSLPAEPTQGDISDEIEYLIDLITSTVNPNTWDSVGGPGAVKEHVECVAIVISNTAESHVEIRQLLAEVREAKAKQPAGPKPAHAAEDQLLVIGYELIYDPAPQNAKGETIGPEPEHIDTKLLAEMIRTVVVPDSWQENKQAYISSLPDRLLVRQEKRVHREIEVLLNQLGLEYISGSREDTPATRRAGSQFLYPRFHRTPATGGASGPSSGGGGIFNLLPK